MSLSTNNNPLPEKIGKWIFFIIFPVVFYVSCIIKVEIERNFIIIQVGKKRLIGKIYCSIPNVFELLYT